MGVTEGIPIRSGSGPQDRGRTERRPVSLTTLCVQTDLGSRSGPGRTGVFGGRTGTTGSQRRGPGLYRPTQDRVSSTGRRGYDTGPTGRYGRPGRATGPTEITDPGATPTHTPTLSRNLQDPVSYFPNPDWVLPLPSHGSRLTPLPSVLGPPCRDPNGPRLPDEPPLLSEPDLGPSPLEGSYLQGPQRGPGVPGHCKPLPQSSLGVVVFAESRDNDLVILRSRAVAVPRVNLTHPNSPRSSRRASSVLDAGGRSGGACDGRSPCLTV